MDDEPRTPKSEFLMAIAGPISSLALAVGFYAVYVGVKAVAAPAAVAGVLGYLAWINVLLAFFNLLPAFPLDGGRVLRSALWAWKKNLRWATRIASGIGSGFGIALVVIGILSLLAGNFVGGLWWCLIGIFLRGISQGSYRQVMIRETLAGEPVRRFMRKEPVSVPPELTVAELVNDFIYEHHFKMFPVVDGDRLMGCVSTREIKKLPREAWETRKVAEILADCSDKNTVASGSDAAEALLMMNRTGNSRLMVVENDRLVGIVALKDMLKFLALKLDLEGDEVEADKLGARNHS